MAAPKTKGMFKMKKFIRCFVLALIFSGFIGDIIVHPNVAMADDIDKILKAKDIVRKMVNYPDTLVFHDLYTQVKRNIVTLKFTCKNGYGVPETHVMDIKVE
jgi:hypothetical protein